jgi:hypothetical protein
VGGCDPDWSCDEGSNFIRGATYSQTSLTDGCSAAKVCDANPVYGGMNSISSAVAHCKSVCLADTACEGFFFQKHTNGHEICGYYDQGAMEAEGAQRVHDGHQAGSQICEKRSRVELPDWADLYYYEAGLDEALDEAPGLPLDEARASPTAEPVAVVTFELALADETVASVQASPFPYQRAIADSLEGVATTQVEITIKSSRRLQQLAPYQVAGVTLEVAIKTTTTGGADSIVRTVATASFVSTLSTEMGEEGIMSSVAVDTTTISTTYLLEEAATVPPPPAVAAAAARQDGAAVTTSARAGVAATPTDSTTAEESGAGTTVLGSLSAAVGVLVVGLIGVIAVYRRRLHVVESRLAYETHDARNLANPRLDVSPSWEVTVEQQQAMDAASKSAPLTTIGNPLCL